MKELLHQFIDSLTDEGAAWLHGFITHLFHKDKPKEAPPVTAEDGPGSTPGSQGPGGGGK